MTSWGNPKRSATSEAMRRCWLGTEGLSAVTASARRPSTWWAFQARYELSTPPLKATTTGASSCSRLSSLVSFSSSCIPGSAGKGHFPTGERRRSITRRDLIRLLQRGEEVCESAGLEVGFGQGRVKLDAPAASDRHEIYLVRRLEEGRACPEHHRLAAVDLMMVHDLVEHLVGAADSELLRAESEVEPPIQVVPIT